MAAKLNYQDKVYFYFFELKVSKTQRFMLISNPPEKFQKDVQKSFNQNKVDEHEQKWKSAYFRHILWITFLVWNLVTFSTDSKSA